jgi:hypothetical protein
LSIWEKERLYSVAKEWRSGRFCLQSLSRFQGAEGCEYKIGTRKEKDRLIKERDIHLISGNRQRLFRSLDAICLTLLVMAAGR